MTPDLFDMPVRESYPDHAGWKGKATSRAAAEAIQPALPRLEQMVVDAIRDHGPMTADECALVVGQGILSIRPRCSQLAKENREGGPLLRDSGITRPNATSGKQATVWALIGDAAQ